MAKKATRESYGAALVKYGEDKNIVVLDADLSKSTKTEMFKNQYPDRFINCGIAEANMMCVAAGLASTGKTVFASTFAMFAAGRAFEQIRNSIGYTKLNVKIGATHAGISVGEDGASHQCLEDLALMRTIPGMVVLNPADPVEAMKLHNKIWNLGVRTAIANGGVVNDHHGVGIKLGRLMKEQYGPAMQVFEGLKKQLDPNGIMNPFKLGL